MHIVLIDVFWQKFDEQVSIAALLLVRHPKCVHNLVQSGTHLKQARASGYYITENVLWLSTRFFTEIDIPFIDKYDE